MKNFEYPKILKCIRCNKNDFEYTQEGHELVCKNCNQHYPVTENMPIILPEGKDSPGLKSEIHQDSGTIFNYIDHYQKDAYTADYFGERDPGTEHSERRVREYIASHITKNQGLILDVGCGKAWVAKLFCPRNFDVVSMDISLLNTSKALKLYPYKNHHALVADVFNLPLAKNTFDYVIASEIIEHVHDPHAFIKNLFNVLKPGGKLIVTTPYKEKIQYMLCIHCNKPTPVHAHIQSFDENKLKSLFFTEKVSKWNYKTFANKILLHLRTHVLMNHLPFSIWKNIDDFFNKLHKVPARILVVWEKRL